MWLRVERLEFLLAGVEIDETELESATLRRLIGSPIPASPSSPTTDTALTTRVSKVHDEWKDIVLNKAKVASIIDNILQLQGLCNEVAEIEESLKEQGKITPTGSLYKLKSLGCTDWDSLRETCIGVDQINQLSSSLETNIDQVACMAAVAKSARDHQLARRAKANALKLKTTSLWDRVRYLTSEVTRKQQAWSLLLGRWEDQIDTALREKGIEPVTE
eukprot:TRINITY_DN4732_c0_g1_i4.p1 TRINITY_DN4732_c0_g1~~TRINITY_DN4732_c0_g1_i4.p1  ORF type:complete len:239 (+),score=53.61 TRINITY_DN4732_c0_g1_i4:64-717(+)